MTVHWKRWASTRIGIACKTVKLREPPKALTTKRGSKEIPRGQGNDLGYGKNVNDVTMENLQPSSKLKENTFNMSAVHRLNGGRISEEK